LGPIIGFVGGVGEKTGICLRNLVVTENKILPTFPSLVFLGGIK
jgi:hypothetical protein